MYLRRITGQCQCVMWQRHILTCGYTKKDVAGRQLTPAHFFRIFMSLPCSSISADMSTSGITPDVDRGVAVDTVSVVTDGFTSTSVDSPFESTSSTCPSLHVSPPPRRRRDKT